MIMADGKKGRKVLIVDDSKEFRDWLDKSLADFGYNISTAPDGFTGLDIYKDQKPDIIITDFLMPILSGLEFAKKIREYEAATGKKAYIILMSLEEIEEKIWKSYGIDNYFNKRGKPNNMFEVIRGATA